MKKTQSSVVQRRSSILEQIKLSGSAKVEQIAEKYNISPLTVRRDFDALEKMGLLRRYHGGAIYDKADSPAQDGSASILLLKHSIAKKAAELVEDGDTIFINTSSTALLVLKYITAEQVTVITNNGNALFKDKKDDTILIFTGGEVRLPKVAMVGEFSTNNLSNVHANKCFIGCAGISVEQGITSIVLQEAAINELMIRNTNGEKIILCDHRKFGRSQSFRICGISDVTKIITDTQLDDRTIESFRKFQTPIIQVKTLKMID